jgi:hypothetical protein
MKKLSPCLQGHILGDMYLEWLNDVLSEPNIPQIIRISHGDKEQNRSPPEYAKACDLFSQLGARGVSVLFATGDDGVGKGDDKGQVQFIPNFPAFFMCGIFLSLREAHKRSLTAGPWVTNVGGTMGCDPEVATSLRLLILVVLPGQSCKAASTFLPRLDNGDYPGLFKSVSCRDLTGIYSQSLISAALWGTASPTFLHRWSTSCPFKNTRDWHKLHGARASLSAASFLRSSSSILEQSVHRPWRA